MKTAQQATAKWQAGVQAGMGSYQAGVQAAANSNKWQQNTLAAVDSMVAGFQQAVADGRVSRGIQNKNTWGAKTLAKAGNWQTGVSGATAAYQNAYTTKLQPMIEAGLGAIAGLPRGGYAANKARLNAYLDAVHQAAQNM